MSAAVVVPPDAHRERGLDWLNLFVAAVQTGFGAFVPVYLTLNAWTQTQIGVVLSAETVASMAGQVPGGALVDLTPRRRRVLAGAILAIAATALVLAASPLRLPVLGALILHAFAGCVLAPAIAAVSLALVGHAGLGVRLGRNVRFASIGSALGAAAMGATGSLLSERAVFLLTACLALPALWALRATGPAADAPNAEAAANNPADDDGTDTVAGAGQALGAIPDRAGPSPRVLALLRDRRLLVFAACVLLFHLSSAAILPVAAGEVTHRAGKGATLVIAAFIMVPQIVVALLSPAVGRAAEQFGRRRLLLLGFLALPLRGALFAVVGAPSALVAVQALEGVGGAVFGVMVPLVAADITRRTGHYSLCLGLLGLVTASGAALSTTLAGAIADLWGKASAFGVLGGIGMLAVLLVLAAMPETREAAPPTHQG
ncbi:MFS transporter [Limobrevibacterium gyesilva]|uniref:MFS transporter n=1 Tax=Limobrevibacterium gyesilva TaxID=2991712 RepID=A0AA41YJQ4_9PROT|nr:MFS transporter [Limobrevibacterium gyesilva]MCW3473850.1 MFS transporter [Limobrevibacterium gyesilva]